MLAAQPDPLAGSRQPARERGLGHPLAVNRGVEPQAQRRRAASRRPGLVNQPRGRTSTSSRQAWPRTIADDFSSTTQARTRSENALATHRRPAASGSYPQSHSSGRSKCEGSWTRSCGRFLRTRDRQNGRDALGEIALQQLLDFVPDGFERDVVGRSRLGDRPYERRIGNIQLRRDDAVPGAMRRVPSDRQVAMIQVTVGRPTEVAICLTSHSSTISEQAARVSLRTGSGSGS